MFDFPESSLGVLFGSITMVAWGIWLVLGNAASESIDPKTAAGISYGVAGLVAVAFVLASGASLAVTPRGGLLAVVAGVFAAVGLVSTYVGLSVGSTATVSTVGAMYFVVAALIGVVVLGDELTATNAAGLAFAALGVVLITQ